MHEHPHPHAFAYLHRRQGDRHHPRRNHQRHISAAHHHLSRAEAAPLHPRGQAPLLRQRLPQRRRHPLPPRQGRHHRKRQRRTHHHPLHRRRDWPSRRRRFAQNPLSRNLLTSHQLPSF